MRRLLLLTVVAAHGAFAQGTGGRAPVPAVATDPTDTTALYRRVQEAEQGFLAQWYKAWRASESQRAGALKSEYENILDARQLDLSCNPDPRMYKPDRAWGANPKVRRIASANGKLGVCPNWFPPTDYYIRPPDVGDERLGIDGAIEPKLRPAVTTARRELIGLMDTALKAMPANMTITGQLVRLLVDQGELDHALSVAHACNGNDWWCNAVTGYVLARRGDLLGAEKSFAVATGWLVEEDRCRWADVSALLDSAGRAAYSQLSCPGREEFNYRFWWLSDPLWSAPGNDRLTEQFTRRVTARLHAATTRDERYIWVPAFGGDAMEAVINRYGWPTYTYWGTGVRPGLPTAPFANGKADMSNRWPIRSLATTERRNATLASTYAEMAGAYATCTAELPTAHGAKSLAMCTGINIGPMYLPETPFVLPPIGAADALSVGSTLEYSLDRVNAIPVWNALRDPFNARSTDWTLNAPRNAGDVFSWWPNEHYAPASPIVQFTDVQYALLRREQHTLLAFATNLGTTDLGRQVFDSVSATLLYSTDPGTIAAVETARRAATDRLVFFHPLPRNPIVASVEVPWDIAGKPAARVRFGITPPSILAQMTLGETDISEPIFLLGPAGAAVLPNDASAAIPLMLGTTTLSAGTQALGVYWETYGFAAGDTVEVSLRVQRQTPLTVLEQAALAAGIGANANLPVTMSWQEPAPGRNTRTIAGAVPVQMRSVVLGISSLRKGVHTLAISVGKPGKPPVRSQRTFVVR